jgi:hypothetical protein
MLRSAPAPEPPTPYGYGQCRYCALGGGTEYVHAFGTTYCTRTLQSTQETAMMIEASQTI